MSFIIEDIANQTSIARIAKELATNLLSMIASFLLKV